MYCCKLPNKCIKNLLPRTNNYVNFQQEGFQIIANCHKETYGGQISVNEKILWKKKKE